MLDPGLKNEIECALSGHCGEPVRITNSRSLSGGCINNAQRLETSAGSFFLKSNPRPLPQMFPREAQGLAALHETGAITVPQPISSSDGGPAFPPYLLTTFIESGARVPDFSEGFGRAFAELHRRGSAERFGFHDDNYLGSTPQPNGWMEDWTAFFRERRLGHLLRLCRESGRGGAELQRLGDRLLNRLDTLIAEPVEPPALLHGDLWGGNYLVDSEGGPALIDPACYYGRREADLAMTSLFGGFDSRFYAAYQEAWPLAAGSHERQEIYQLYHLLNHFHLFGGSYLGGCMEILNRYA